MSHSESQRLAEHVAEGELTLPRVKQVSVAISLAYRAKNVLKALVGRKVLLRRCLDGAWLLRRFAYELSGEEFGGRFHCLSLGLSEEILSSLIPPDGSVIDVGCGDGRWCRAATRYAARVVGVDRNETLITRARDTGEDTIDYRIGDVTSCLTDEKYDLALLIHVIEHVDDAEALLRQVKGIAKRLVVEVPDFEADALNLVRHHLGCSFYSDGDHVREYTLDILVRQLERSGWVVERAERRSGMLLVVAEHRQPRGAR